MFSRFAAVAALALVTFAPGIAHARLLQCVPYARAVSGIDIRGNAETWWGQAAGRYERGNEPRVGAVMAMPGISKMPYGHVAMVSKIVNDREILLDHANWSRRGGIERGVRAVDVSEKGDWSRVRVWHGPSGGLGTTAYPVSGFIYSGKDLPRVEFAAAKPKTDRGPLVSADVIRLASLESTTPAGSGVALLRR